MALNCEGLFIDNSNCVADKVFGKNKNKKKEG